MTDEDCFLPTKTSDGLDMGIVNFESALINGKGESIYSETACDQNHPVNQLSMSS